MRIRHIEILHAIMKEGSISAAAKVLGVSQPALSMSLRQAEDSLKYQLFVRTKNGLRATKQAEQLFEQSKELMNSLGRISKLATNLKKESNELLRIGTVPALAFEVVPRAITQLLNIYPQLRFQIKTVSYDNARDALTNADIDFALLFGEPDWSGFNAIPAGTGRVMVAANSQLGKSREISLADIRGREIIGISDSGPLGHLIDHALEAADIPVSNQIVTETYYAACHFAQAGMGIALVDNFTSRAMIHSGTQFSDISDLDRFSLSCIYRHGTALDDVYNDLMAEISDIVGEFSGK